MRRRTFALGCIAVLTACSSANTPTASVTSPPATASSAASPPSVSDSASGTDAFTRRLREKLTLPPLPAFALPTDLLTTAADRSLAGRLKLQPGLYRGIAVLDARCDRKGSASPIDRGPAATGAAGAGHYRDARRSITVAANGTGVYDSAALHISVLAGGAGVYDDGSTRVAVKSDGSGTYRSGAVRYTVRADGSGSYSDARSRIWVQPDGSGGYDEGALHITRSVAGTVFGHGDPGQVAGRGRRAADSAAPLSTGPRDPSGQGDRPFLRVDH